MYRGNFNDDRNFDRFLFSQRRNSEIVNLDNRTLKSHRSRNITLFKFSFTRPPRERANKPANLETTFTLVDSKTERNKTEWTERGKRRMNRTTTSPFQRRWYELAVDPRVTKGQRRGSYVPDSGARNAARSSSVRSDGGCHDDWQGSQHVVHPPKG